MQDVRATLLKAFSAKLLLIAAIAFAPISAAWAHSFDTLTVSRFSVAYGFVEIYLADTVKDQDIVCAAYDGADQLVASDSWTTDNLATKALISYDGNEVASVKCVFN